MASKLGLAGLALASLVSLGGCADGYGYSGVSLGYGTAYGGDYYDDGYDNVGYYGGGYGGGYYGWYGDYYYPGSGFYVYDRYRRPYRWNDSQRHYWEGRRGNGYRGGNHANWGHFDRSRGQGGYAGGGYRGNRQPNGQTQPDRSGYRQHYQGNGQAFTGNRPNYDQQGSAPAARSGYTARDLGRSGYTRSGPSNGGGGRSGGGRSGGGRGRR